MTAKPWRWGAFARIALIVATSAALFAPILAPALTGTRWVVVEGSSMAPTLHYGEVIVVDPERNAQVGDVVTYTRPNGSLVTHRAVAITGTGQLELRGDANAISDPRLVHTSALLGVVVASIDTPWSTLLRAASSGWGKATLIGAVALLLIAPALLRRLATNTPVVPDQQRYELADRRKAT